MTYEVVARLTAQADTKEINKFNDALDRLYKRAKSPPDLFKQGAQKLDFKITGAENAINQLSRMHSLTRKIASDIGAINSVRLRSPQMPNPQMPNRQLTNNGVRGRTWAESSPVDRLKWRAGAEATYRTFDKIGVGTRTAGQGIAQNDTQRSLNSIILNDPAQQKKLEQESLQKSGSYQMIGQASFMEIGREAIANLKKAEEFPLAMEGIAKTTQALALQYGDSKKGADAALKAYKAADVSGFADSAEQQNKFLEAYGKQSLLSGKDLSPELAKNAFRKMGSLRLGLDSNAIAETIMAVDEFQGDAGAVMRQFNRALTAGNVAKNKQELMKGAGLRDSTGAVDAATLKSNPFDWVQKHIAPKMQKAGIDLSDVTAESVAKMEKELQKIGFTGEEGKFAKWALTKNDEITRARARRNKMDYSDDKIKGQVGGSIQATNAAVSAQFQNAADSMTKSLQPMYSSIMGGLSSLLNKAANKPAGAWGAAGVAGTAGLVGGWLLQGGVDGINNKLTVTNMLLGKMALSQSLGGVGGKLPQAGGVIKSVVAPAAVAILAYQAFGLLKDIPVKDGKSTNDLNKGGHETLYEAYKDKIDRLINGKGTFMDKLQVPQAYIDRRKKELFEKNGKGNDDEKEKEELKRKYGLENWQHEKSIIEAKRREARERIDKNLKGDGIAYDDYGKRLYKPQENSGDADYKSTVDKAKAAFEEMGTRIAQKHTDVANAVASALQSPEQTAKNLGTTLIDGLGGAVKAAQTLVSTLAGIANIQPPTGGIPKGSLNTGTIRPNGS